jgi:hypothetical protein
MLVLGNEALEVRFRVSESVRPRHANRVKALRTRLLGERRLDRA